MHDDPWLEEIDHDFLDSVRDELGQTNGEWVSFVALRDGISLALNDTNKVTRAETLRLARLLIPGIFSRDSSTLGRDWVSREENLLLEKAEMQKLSFDRVLDEEISALERDLQAYDPHRRQRANQSRLDTLKRIRQENKKSEYYEGKLIHADASLGDSLPGSNGKDFFEFLLPQKQRGLRIRITHETAIEAINGVDLVYEHHEPKNRRARIVVVQYKVLNENRIIPKSRKLAAQLKRLDTWFCNNLPCIEKEKVDSQFYRLPSCSAFLRATNRLQAGNSSGVSSGYYIPVCRIREHYKDRRHSISDKNYEGEAITHRVFEDVFNSGMLGSRWFSYEELAVFYERQKMVVPGGTVSMQLQVLDKL